MLRRDPLESRVLKHIITFEMRGLTSSEHEETRSIRASFPMATQTEATVPQLTTTVSTTSIRRLLGGAENPLRIISEISKEVCEEIVTDTLGALCLEEARRITKDLKAFWMKNLRQTSRDDSLSGNKRPSLRDVMSDLDESFETHLDNFWEESGIEILPLEDLVTPPAPITDGDIFLLGFAVLAAKDGDELRSR